MTNGPNPDNIIHVRGLQKIFHLGEVDVPALRGVDLDVARAEFLAVIGPSGSGKSTLFNILGGLAAPTAGTVTIDGVDLSKLTDSERTELRQRKIGFVFQKYNLLPTLTARDNIGIAQTLAGNPPRAPHFDEILKSLGIESRLDHKRTGQTILMITHNPEAAAFAD